HAEAKDLIALGDRHPPALARAAIDSQAIERATPAHSRGGGLVRTGRVLLGRDAIVVLVVIVAAPLPDIAVHVVQAKPIGFVRADLGGPANMDGAHASP